MLRGRVPAFGVMVAGLALASCAGAQRPPAAQPLAGPAPVFALTATSAAPGGNASEANRKLLSQLTPAEEKGDLPLGPGDLIEVAVFEVPEFQGLRLRIPDSGQITLPLIGAMSAADRTAADLQNEIRARLQENYVHDPQVSVFIHEHRSQRISVIGAVRSGGTFTLTSRLRLTDALAMAGGLSDDAAGTIRVIRRVSAQATNGAVAGAQEANEPVVMTIAIESLVAGKEEANLPVQSGDVVEVPRAGTFYVGGEVNKPGSFLLRDRTTLDQVAHLAGGVKDVADWDDVRLYRLRPDATREVERYSLNDFEQGKPGPALLAGDVVVVGKSNLKAFLYGVREIFKFGIGATASVPLFP